MASVVLSSPWGSHYLSSWGGGAGEVWSRGCWGLQAHRTLRLFLSVRYRLWETGNICETGQTGGGKRLGLVFSGQPAGWLGVTGSSPARPDLPLAAPAHRGT